jgi:AP-1-like factor
MAYPYYSAAPQSVYQFLGLTPTPVHSGSANTDEFNTSSPVRDPANLHLNLDNNSHHPFLTTKQDPYDQYPQFDYSQFTSLPHPEPPTPLVKPAVSSGSHGSDPNTEFNDEATRRGSNSDDDDNMTPAQSRRKAQNRAASASTRILFFTAQPANNPADKEPSVSAKSGMLKTSKPNLPSSKRTLPTWPKKTSA